MLIIPFEEQGVFIFNGEAYRIIMSDRSKYPAGIVPGMIVQTGHPPVPVLNDFHCSGNWSSRIQKTAL
jgi:hypothetical protein